MISQTAEYALRAVVHLARFGDAGQTTRQIADATSVPMAYLSKVVQSLVRAGIVASRRGIGGGCVLVRPPGALTIFEIIEAVEPIQRIRCCPLGLEEHREELCPLHQRLDDAMAYVEASFKATTVDEILNTPGKRSALCSRGEGTP